MSNNGRSDDIIWLACLCCSPAITVGFICIRAIMEYCTLFFSIYSYSLWLMLENHSKVFSGFVLLFMFCFYLVTSGLTYKVHDIPIAAVILLDMCECWAVQYERISMFGILSWHFMPKLFPETGGIWSGLVDSPCFTVREQYDENHDSTAWSHLSKEGLWQIITIIWQL